VLAGAIILVGVPAFVPSERANIVGAAPASVFGPNVRVDDTGNLMGARGLSPHPFVDENGTIYVVWGDGRASPGKLDQDDGYFSKSVDGGRTYSPNVPIAVTANMSGGAIIDVAEDGTIFVVLGEYNQTTGLYHYSFSTSTDGGSTFSTPVFIDGHRWNETFVGEGGTLIHHGNTVYLSWLQMPGDARGIGVFLARSTDRGKTWEAPVRIDDAGTDDIHSPDMAVDDAGIVYVVWADYTTNEIRLARSLDFGLTFGPSIAVSLPGWNVSLAAVAARGPDEAYVLWNTFRSPANYSGTLFISKVTGGGTAVLPPTQVRDVPANSSQIAGGSFALDVDRRGFVYVAWCDTRNSPYEGDVYFARSIDGGRSFEPNERVEDTPVPDGIGQAYPDVATNGNGTVVVVWSDGRRDPDGLDVYSAVSTSLPDLAVNLSDLSWSPSSPKTGDHLVINATVHNIGWAASAPTNARFYEGRPPAPQIGTDRPLPLLSVNETADVSVTWNGSAPGEYEICVFADPQDLISELNETNNIACASVRVLSLPDLMPTAVVTTPASPIQEGTLTSVNVTIGNTGNLSTGTFDLLLFDDSNRNLAPDPGEDIGTQSLPDIAGNSQSYAEFAWTASPASAHSVCAYADPPPGTVNESNETNNVMCVDVAVQPGPILRPDYVPVSPAPLPLVRVGMSSLVSLSIQVLNQGNGTATDDGTVAFYNQSSPPFSTSVLSPLAPATTSSRFTATWTSPATPGAYLVSVDVDYYDNATEWDETNNVFTWTIEVVSGPITSLVIGNPNHTSTATYVKSTTSLDLSVVDQSGLGVNHTWYRIDGGGWNDYSSSFFLTTEGQHLVEWYSEDKAGNVEAVNTQTLRVDDTPPATSLSIGNPRYLVGGNFVRSSTLLARQAADGGVTPVGIDFTKYRIDGGVWNDYSAAFNLAGEGQHVVEYYSSDFLTNQETAKSIQMIVDDSPPATAISIGEPRYSTSSVFVKSTTPLALTATDGGVGYNSTFYRLWDGLWSPWLQHSSSFNLAGSDGTWYVEYLSFDHLGNKESVKNETLILDDTAPVTTLSPATGPYTIDTMFSLAATDAGCGVNVTMYRIDGGNWSVYSGGFTLADGNHNISYYSNDHLNNTEAVRWREVTVQGATQPPPPSVEANYKPLIALVFAIVLAVVGYWSSRKRPWKGGKERMAVVKAFTITSIPFVIAEATTGAVSLLTGQLSIPPLLGAGTAIDVMILVIGIATAIVRQRKNVQQMEKAAEDS